MKTLCLSLGMLLLISCCCNAMPQAMRYNTAPVTCCDKFSTMRIPEKFVSDIIKTHSSCIKRGFIAKTVKGRLICFSQNFDWATKTYDRIHNSEGSGLLQ